MTVQDDIEYLRRPTCFKRESDIADTLERLSSENREFRTLLRMVLANLKNSILGGISDEQILAIDEALGYPFDSALTRQKQRNRCAYCLEEWKDDPYYKCKCIRQANES